MKLTCVIINRNNFRARIFNQIQIPARETSRSLGSRLRRSPLAIRDRLVGKSNFDITAFKPFMNNLTINTVSKSKKFKYANEFINIVRLAPVACTRSIKYN